MILKACASVLCLSLTVAAVAGPLDPPPGPVTDTEPTLGYKTLFQVEPRTPIAAADFPMQINRPGSYYLVENVPFIGANGEHGIEILVNDVTIDLNGFTLEGANEIFVGGTGIRAINRRNIHIKNGAVRNWGQGGISLSSSENCIIGHVRVENCQSTGIQGGSRARIHDCTVLGSGGTGISASGSAISGCAVRDSGSDGIFTSSGSSVINSISHGNDGRGIVVSAGGSITSCGTSQNSSWGMQAINGSSISNSGSSQDSSGFDALDGSTITNCAANDHQTAVGISVRQGSLADSCTVFQGAGNGIQVSSGSTVRHCNVSNVGAAGIIAQFSFSDSRIEGNNVSDCATGIEANVASGGNLIISNSLSNNGVNFVLNVSNSIGQITAVGGATITTGNPWANLVY